MIKSNIIRKLFGDEKYAKLLKQIEIKNEIMAEFLLELAHIGTNINQIAYHLNINIYENNIENKMGQYLREIKKFVTKHKNKFVSHTKLFIIVKIFSSSF